MKLQIETEPEELAAFLMELKERSATELLDNVLVQENAVCTAVDLSVIGLPSRLRALRLSKQLTAKEVGDAIGVDKSTISQYEADRREPNIERLMRLSRFFGVTVDKLLGLEEGTYFLSV